jgi:hypothetical protein
MLSKQYLVSKLKSNPFIEGDTIRRRQLYIWKNLDKQMDDLTLLPTRMLNNFNLLSYQAVFYSQLVQKWPPLWSSGQSSWLYNGDVLCFL